MVINAEPPDTGTSVWVEVLLGFGPTLLLVGLFIFISRRLRAATGGAGGPLGAFGRSRAKRYEQDEQRVSFAEVAGIDDAEAELEEVVDFLRNPSRYTRLGARVPKGVLLAGLPGTGKTLLARAVAGEADVPFFSISASEFVEAIVGVGASRVRDLFAQAKAAAPAIIFIDELDAIGRARGASGSFGGNDEREQTLNQILTEMDGFTGTEGVIVIASTNRPEVLDPALLRPGRFDRRVVVNPPDQVGREQILAVHTRDVPLADDVDLTSLAASTPGMVGADLRNLVNEAALLAARRNHDRVTQADFTDAMEKIVLGTERKIVLSAAERERTAYHESGHALLGMLVPGSDPVRKVSIIPRGRALGVTFQSPEADRYGYSVEYLRGRLVGALGGRAAEQLVFGDITTGAESDLEQATRIARQMVGRWGMSDAIGPVSVLPGPGGEGQLFPGTIRRLPRRWSCWIRRCAGSWTSPRRPPSSFSVSSESASTTWHTRSSSTRRWTKPMPTGSQASPAHRSAGRGGRTAACCHTGRVSADGQRRDAPSFLDTQYDTTDRLATRISVWQPGPGRPLGPGRRAQRARCDQATAAARGGLRDGGAGRADGGSAGV